MCTHVHVCLYLNFKTGLCVCLLHMLFVPADLTEAESFLRAKYWVDELQSCEGDVCT